MLGRAARTVVCAIGISGTQKRSPRKRTNRPGALTHFLPKFTHLISGITVDHANRSDDNDIRWWDGASLVGVASISQGQGTPAMGQPIAHRDEAQP
jgi:hypothetical protein